MACLNTKSDQCHWQWLLTATMNRKLSKEIHRRKSMGRAGAPWINQAHRLVAVNGQEKMIGRPYLPTLFSSWGSGSLRWVGVFLWRKPLIHIAFYHALNATKPVFHVYVGPYQKKMKPPALIFTFTLTFSYSEVSLPYLLETTLPRRILLPSFLFSTCDRFLYLRKIERRLHVIDWNMAVFQKKNP